MFNSPIVNVIFGLIFIFSLLSILVTQINTLIASVFNWRAKHLKRGLTYLLTDPVIRAKFLAHPLIRLVPAVVQPSAQIAQADAEAVAQSQPQKVEWIPDELFSSVLLDILNSNAEQQLFGMVNEACERMLNGVEKAQMREMLRRFQHGAITLTELNQFISTKVSDPADQAALLQALEPLATLRQPTDVSDEGSRLLAVLAGIDAIEDPSMRTALQTLVGPAHSLEEAQARLESWFNSSMDRLSVSYRRRMAWVSVLAGVVLAVTLNADTLHMGRTLWTDPALQQALSSAADVAVSSGAIQNSINRAQQNAAGQQPATATPTPDPATAGSFDANGQPAPGNQPSTVDLAFQVGYTFQDLLELRLPIGWTFEPVADGCPQPGLIPDPCSNGRNLWLLLPLNNPNWFGDFAVKIVGIPDHGYRHRPGRAVLVRPALAPCPRPQQQRIGRDANTKTRRTLKGTTGVFGPTPSCPSSS